MPSGLDQLGEDVRWSVEAGRRLPRPQLANAERRRQVLYHRLRVFLEDYEFLLAPVVQVLPFAVEMPYPKVVAGAIERETQCWRRRPPVILEPEEPKALTAPTID